jgi:ABC-type uncharacterized transport system substrate-binding protein
MLRISFVNRKPEGIVEQAAGLAEFERAMIQECVRAGLASARSEGTGVGGGAGGGGGNATSRHGRRRALPGLGWTDGRNVRIDLRWGGGDANRIRAVAQELVGLPPDIIVTGGSPAAAAVQRETRTIAIVFAPVIDPVATGIVPRLNQPGGNITGFASLEASLGGKWLELLSEIAPGLKRAAILFNPDFPTASVYMPSFEAAARSLKVAPRGSK